MAESSSGAYRRLLSSGPSRALAKLGWVERFAVFALVLVSMVAVMAPLLSPYDPYERVTAAFQAPSWAHPFGSDEIGRDLLSRVIYGVRATWIPALVIIGLGLIVGVVVGLISGAYGGWIDRILQRTTDLFLVLPSTLIAIAVVAALGPGLRNTVIAIAVFWWPWYSRITRGDIQSIAARPHVEAARLAGASRRRLLVRYMLPGALPSILVTATLDVANVVLVLALLSFLGLGAPAPAPELGAMTARSLDSLTTAWWLPIFPALTVFILAFAANVAGDGVRDTMESI